MAGGIYGCPAEWAGLLPPGIRRFRTRRKLWAREWDVVALTPEGCAALFDTGGGLAGRLGLRRADRGLSCGVALLPGDCPAERLPLARTARVVSYGLSPRDSLTFSSLEQPTLCVQRALPRPDGATIEPGEIPLPGLPPPVERFLPLLGLWLLCGRDG